MSHFFLIPTLKEFKKSTNICQSYSKNKSGPVFFDSQCIYYDENKVCISCLQPKFTKVSTECVTDDKND